MGPVALFVVLVIMPVVALALVLMGLALSALVGVAVSVPVISWLSFAGGLLLGAGVLWIRRRGRTVSEGVT